MAKIQQTIVDAVVAAGGLIIEPAPSKRYVAIDFAGDRLWIGRLGAIRKGKTIRKAQRSSGHVLDLKHEGKVIARGSDATWGDDDYGDSLQGGW